MQRHQQGQQQQQQGGGRIGGGGVGFAGAFGDDNNNNNVVYFDPQVHNNNNNNIIQQQQHHRIIRGGIPIMSPGVVTSPTRQCLIWSRVTNDTTSTSPNPFGGGFDLPSSSSSSASIVHHSNRDTIKSNSNTSSTNTLLIVPPPRSGAASVVVKGKLYVFGGYGGGTGRLDDFWSYDFHSNCWEEVTVLSSEKPGCRENNGVVISDSSRSIYLFGGYNGSAWLNDLWEFNIETKRWTCIQESTDNVHRHSSGEDAAMPLFDAAAGNNNNNNNNLSSGITAVQGKIPSRRFGYVSVVHEGKFVLFGGFDGSRWLNDMYVFHFETKCWTEIQARGSLPSARSCPAWAKDDTHVYIQGGYDGVERKNDFFAFDLSTYTWSEMPCLGTPPSPRYFHSCCLYNNRMYLYGGYSGSERLADMYAYDFETNHWSQIDCTAGDAPAGRSSLVAQVYENCIYVFGGYNGSTVLNDFYRFRLKPVNVPPSALVTDFQRLINNPELADIQFIVENKPVYAHRAVLAIRSEYFRVMLCGGMRESSFFMSDNTTTATTTLSNKSTTTSVKNEDDTTDIAIDSESSDNMNHHPNAIELPDISYSVFLKVLEFLYTDSVGSVSLEVGIHLLIASEQFMLDRLKGLCEDLIRRDISTETVVSILVASHRHHASCLKDIALEYILQNLYDPVIMTGLAELKAEPDLLLEIIRRNTLNQQQQLLLHHQQQQATYGPNYDGNASMNDVAVAAAAVAANGVVVVGVAGNNAGSGGRGNNNAAAAANNNNIVGPFGSNAEWNGRR